MAGQTSKAALSPAQPRPDDLEGLIGYNLKRAYVIVSNDFRTALEGAGDGFAPRVFSALSIAVQYPDITQSDLARRLGIERSGLVAIVDELEARGYLKRKPVPGDRRAQALAPTQAGRSAYERALAAAHTHEAALFSNFSAEEQATLLTLLRKMRTVEET